MSELKRYVWTGRSCESSCKVEVIARTMDEAVDILYRRTDVVGWGILECDEIPLAICGSSKSGEAWFDEVMSGTVWHIM